MMKAGGTEIGKTLAEKSRGLFSANDWQCKTYVCILNKGLLKCFINHTLEQVEKEIFLMSEMHKKTMHFRKPRYILSFVNML